MIALKNPLTLEERLSITRLIGHDVKSHVAVLGNIAMTNPETGDKERAGYSMNYVGCVLEAFECLTSDEYLLEQTTPNKFRTVLDVLVNADPRNKNQTAVFISLEHALTTSSYVIFAALSNLVKNSFNANFNARVKITISPFSGTVKNVAYSPLGVPAEEAYVSFSVHDDGPGFPTDKPLAEWLELGVSTRGKRHGFGLYFVKLAAKALRAPISIESKPGDTTVSLYHPVNLGL